MGKITVYVTGDMHGCLERLYDRSFRKLKAGDVVTLDGDLGAGKTAFTQGLAKGLEVSDYVSSPTFTIVNCYEGKIPLYHFYLCETL